MKPDPRTLLLAEDDKNDAELTLAALREWGFSGTVVRVADGAEALDFLEQRGRFATRPPGNPFLVLLDLLCG